MAEAADDIAYLSEVSHRCGLPIDVVRELFKQDWEYHPAYDDLLGRKQKEKWEHNASTS